jgi:hypothetical protein
MKIAKKLKNMLIMLKKNRDKLPRKSISRRSSLWWVFSLCILIWWWLILVPTIFQTQEDIQEINLKLNVNEAEVLLKSYFSYIELWDTKDAYSLFSQGFKERQSDWFSWFNIWLKDVVAFEWLKITPIESKSSPTIRVFLVEFWFKKRWMKSVDLIWLMRLRYNKNNWEIHSNDVVYENWWKEKRELKICDIYKVEHCY